VKHSTVRREMTMLTHLFRLACHDWGWIDSVPTATVGKPPSAKPRTRTFTDDEIARIVHVLGFREGHFHGHATASQMTAVAFLLALETAMRSGEVLALTWPHVRERAVHLPQSKTGVARDVPLTLRARELIGWCEGLDDVRVLPVGSSTRCSGGRWPRPA
jgi:integrase